MKSTFKVEKVLNNLIKIYLRRVNGKMEKIVIAEYDNKVFITTDGYAAYILPKQMCPIDIKAIMGDSTFDVKCFMEEISSDNYKDAVMCPELKVIGNGKEKAVTVAKFQQVDVENPQYCYVNTKFLEYFDPNCVTYRVADSNKALRVYENEQLIAYLLPIKLAQVEGENNGD